MLIDNNNKFDFDHPYIILVEDDDPQCSDLQFIPIACLSTEEDVTNFVQYLTVKYIVRYIPVDNNI